MSGAQRGERADAAGATTRIPIKVVPGASRDEIAGWLGDALKVRVTAPPERGRANAAVRALVAAALELSDDRVRIVAGAGSPRKLVEIAGLSPSAVHARLSRSRP